jgi:hypothetical protein
MTRLLQDDSKGLSRWLSSRLDARRVVREVAFQHQQESSIHAGSDAVEADSSTSSTPPEPPPTEDQLAAQDSMWGVTIEEMK